MIRRPGPGVHVAVCHPDCQIIDQCCVLYAASAYLIYHTDYSSPAELGPIVPWVYLPRITLQLFLERLSTSVYSSWPSGWTGEVVYCGCNFYHSMVIFAIRATTHTFFQLKNPQSLSISWRRLAPSPARAASVVAKLVSCFQQAPVARALRALNSASGASICTLRVESIACTTTQW